jgi:hypothetical protein
LLTVGNWLVCGQRLLLTRIRAGHAVVVGRFGPGRICSVRSATCRIGAACRAITYW